MDVDDDELEFWYVYPKQWDDRSAPPGSLHGEVRNDTGNIRKMTNTEILNILDQTDDLQGDEVE